jgi:predicted nucleic acid-binding Zn ribbon protein
MIYYSELFDYIEYETTQQGVLVISTETDEKVLIEKSKTDKQIRQFKPEVIAEMVDIIPSVEIKICVICGKKFYSQTARQTVCSHDCYLEMARQRSKKHRADHKEIKKTTKPAKIDEEKRREETKKEVEKEMEEARKKGISYGKYKAQVYMEQNRERLWGSLYKEIAKGKETGNERSKSEKSKA